VFVQGPPFLQYPNSQGHSAQSLQKIREMVNLVVPIQFTMRPSQMYQILQEKYAFDGFCFNPDNSSPKQVTAGYCLLYDINTQELAKALVAGDPYTSLRGMMNQIPAILENELQYLAFVKYV